MVLTFWYYLAIVLARTGDWLITYWLIFCSGIKGFKEGFPGWKRFWTSKRLAVLNWFIYMGIMILGLWYASTYFSHYIALVVFWLYLVVGFLAITWNLSLYWVVKRRMVAYGF